MRKPTAVIRAVGSFVPKSTLTNEDLAKMVDTSDEWILSRTGIKSRGILQGEEGVSYLAIKAVEDLKRRYPSFDPKDLDLVLLSTSTPDHLVGPTAPVVASNIGAERAFSYDLSAACCGFLYATSLAKAYIESQQYKKVLVIGADKMSSIVDYSDRNTCVLFGDGAGAVLFEANEKGINGVQSEILKSSGTDSQSLYIKYGGSKYPITEEALKSQQHRLFQDGKKVFKMAVSSICEVVQALLEKSPIDPKKCWFLCHQANTRILEAVQETLQLDRERFPYNIKYYGNTSAATIPLLISDFVDYFKKGDDLILTSFGAGFTWGAIHLKWDNT